MVARPYKIDASQIRLFLDCREQYRQAYVLGRASKKPLIHREFGIGFHKGCEVFWKGWDYSAALMAALDYVGGIDCTLLTVKEKQKWDEMTAYMPDLLAAYFDSVEYEPGVNIKVEKEWSLSYDPLGCDYKLSNVTLCGRIDRFTNGFHLIDIKTDSGIDTKDAFREKWLRDVGLALYDWYLKTVDTPPRMVAIERCIKPYRGRPAKVELVELPEITSDGYRKRFEQQLKMVLADMVHHLDNYQDMAPWLMNTNHACTTKYGPCEYLSVCNRGESQRELARFKQREEHLVCRQ